jgi:hypothetical protein
MGEGDRDPARARVPAAEDSDGDDASALTGSSGSIEWARDGAPARCRRALRARARRRSHALARGSRALPSAGRDQEGLALEPNYVPAPGDALAFARSTFFGVIGFLVDAGVSLVAEAAFSTALGAGLTPLLDRASPPSHCRVDAAIAWERISRRAESLRRLIHGDPSWMSRSSFRRSTRASPRAGAAIDVDTTDGWTTLEEIAFSWAVRGDKSAATPRRP